MKSRWIALPAMIVMTLSLIGGMTVAADQPTPQGPVEVRVTQADNGRQFTLRGSDVLALNLEANPSTGYSWVVEGMDRRMLRQVANEFVSQSTMLGAPETQVLRFQGIAAGRTEIRLSYRRPWESESLGNFAVQVEVVDPAGRLGRAAPDVAAEPAVSEPAPYTTTSLPASFNWCDLGGCTPVRDQGACGSCWAFGTVGPLESAILIQDGISRDLAEQYLVSCNTDGWGCNGGWWAHDYHEWKIPPGEPAAGAVYEADFPYAATDLPCNGPYVHHETIADWVYIGTSSTVPPVDAIKQAILDHGPVSAAVCVDTAFQNYTGGVLQNTRCKKVNHAIVLVGWDDSLGAWILRNSWGENWGLNGYMYIGYGVSLVGYGANYVVYNGGGTPPTPTPTPTPTPPPANTMHVSAIDMWYTQAGRNYNIYTKVTVVNASGSPVANATVNLRVTTPSGSIANGTATTGTDGTVTFYLTSKVTGTYVSEVTNITHSTYTYNPAANVETSESLRVP